MKRACETFREALLDLAYDEVPGEEAARLREHAASCAECREALESILLTRKLAGQLPLPEPEGISDESILRAAAEAAEDLSLGSIGDDAFERTADPAAARRALEPEPGLLDRIRAFLLTPALVTAGVACAVLGFTLFLSRGVPPEERVREEATGAPFLGPAVPLASETEASDLPRLEEKAPPVGSIAAAPAGGPTRAGASIGTAAETRSAEGLRGARGLGTEGPLPSRKKESTSVSSSGAAGGATSYLSDDEPELDDLARQAAEKSSAGLEEAEETSASFAKAPGSGKPSAAQEPAPRDSFSAELSYREGMAAYNRGDCASATRHLEAVLASPRAAPDRVPSALHHIARCEKRTGRCGSALPHYEDLLEEHPGYPDRAEALWEAASCHRRLGHVERARALLDELARYPGWRERARREIEKADGIDGDPED